MPKKMMNIKVFRFDPSTDQEPYFQTYQVPYEEGMSAMTALDYIYQNLDSTLAYYDHAACDLGICARCTGIINGQAGLFCQTVIRGDVALEPTSRARVLKDLVVKKGKGGNGENWKSRTALADGSGGLSHLAASQSLTCLSGKEFSFRERKGKGL